MHPNPLAKINAALESRTFVKAIAGIDQTDPAAVLPVIEAANGGGATAVDVACDEALVRMVKTATDLPVFVSSIDPELLLRAEAWGADVLELGNYDALYRQGIVPTATQILGWTRTIRARTAMPLSVTVCGRLSLTEQLDLARALQAAGADILQTEGVLAGIGTAADGIEVIADALTHTQEIARVVELPCFVAGGVTPKNAAFALAAGAAGVGLGRVIRQQPTADARADVIARTVEALVTVRIAGKPLAIAR